MSMCLLLLVGSENLFMAERTTTAIEPADYLSVCLSKFFN